jgi:hypothetical protein
MAAKKAQATNGGTGTDTTPAASTTKTRGPKDPATTVYWDDTRKAALLALLYSQPGKLTGTQVAQTLANHPAFIDQQALFGSTDRAVGEKVRQQVVKLAKIAREKGYQEPQLKRTASGHGNIDAVFAQAMAAVGIGQPAPVPANVQVQSPGQGTGLIGGGIPLVPQGVGGLLIPVPNTGT